MHTLLVIGITVSLLGNIVQWLRLRRMNARDRDLTKPVLVASSVILVVLIILIIFW